jgi:hypothetical protein
MSLRAAQVRIYVDADVLGLGKVLADLRNDVTYPGDPGAVIHKRQRVFMTQWRRIEALISEPGPFIWRVSRTAITSITLD